MIWWGDRKSRISFDETLLRMRVVVRPGVEPEFSA